MIERVYNEVCYTRYMYYTYSNSIIKCGPLRNPQQKWWMTADNSTLSLHTLSSSLPSFSLTYHLCSPPFPIKCPLLSTLPFSFYLPFLLWALCISIFLSLFISPYHFSSLAFLLHLPPVVTIHSTIFSSPFVFLSSSDCPLLAAPIFSLSYIFFSLILLKWALHTVPRFYTLDHLIILPCLYFSN